MNDKTWILVVDDEDSVLQLMAIVLRIAGHRVSTASDGYGALELCREQIPDLIVCDIHLHPAFTGMELVRHLRVRQPDLKALFVSGLDDWSGVEDMAITGSDAFLAKPFSPTSLPAKVSETLAGRDIAASNL
jgi:DNA-binding response OmpR family regulator